MLCSYLSHHWRSHTGIKSHHCKECEEAFSQRSYLVQHQIYSMQKACECNKCVCVKIQSYFSPHSASKNPYPREAIEYRSSSLFHHQNIYTRPESDITQMEKIYCHISGFSQHQNIGEKIVNYLHMKSLIYSPNLFHCRRI